MDVKDPILAQYERIKQSREREERKTTNRVPFNVKNYLNVRLDPGESMKKLTIRILQLTPDSESPFKPIAMHYFAPARKTFVCTKNTNDLPEGTDTRCPFCELKEEVSKKQQGADAVEWNRLKEIYKNNGHSIQYVLRVIDRDDEGHGVKFWKITQPVYENLISIYSLNKEDGINIFDYEEGKDLVITIQKQNSKNRITSIQAKNRVSPLAETEELKQEYISDTKLWNNVYGIKTYDYLSILIGGGEPYYDKEANMWVDKQEIEDKRQEDNEREEEFNYELEDDDEDSGDGEIDDLPF